MVQVAMVLFMMHTIQGVSEGRSFVGEADQWI